MRGIIFPSALLQYQHHGLNPYQALGGGVRGGGHLGSISCFIFDCSKAVCGRLMKLSDN